MGNFGNWRSRAVSSGLFVALQDVAARGLPWLRLEVLAGVVLDPPSNSLEQLSAMSTALGGQPRFGVDHQLLQVLEKLMVSVGGDPLGMDRVSHDGLGVGPLAFEFSGSFDQSSVHGFLPI